jgi:DNA-binding transcriptional MocR family regulator
LTSPATLQFRVIPDGNASNALVDELEAAVAAGRPGDRLPSVRELMRRHRAGPATVQRAVHQLVRRGVLDARPGRGTFIAPPRATAEEAPDHAWQTVALGARSLDETTLEQLVRSPPPGMLVLSTGYLPEDLQPHGALGQALARAARRPGAWSAMPTEGLTPLRGLFAGWFGGGHTADDVLVVSGGQSALTACLRGLAAPGGPVIVESPTYPGALAAARAANLVTVPVPSDEHGIRPDLLADALSASGARVVYCQPTHANPHGAVLAPERRAGVLAAVRSAGAFLVEDDPVRDLTFEPAAVPPPLSHDDPDGHVVHITSLTKVGAPSLRIGAIAARGPAFARLRSARVVEDFFVAGPLQEAAIELLGAPAWPRHLKRLRAALRERRDALAAAVGRELGPGRMTAPSGGMHAWVRLDPREDDVAVAERAYREGVKVFAGRPWFTGEPPAPYLRLTFAAEPPERLAEGVRLLGAVR